MNLLQKKVQKSLFTQLQGYVKAAKNIAKNWGIDYLPLSTLIELTEKLKMESEDELLEAFIQKHNKLIESLIAQYKAIGKKLNTKNISIKIIEMQIATIKSNYVKGGKEK